MPCTCVGFAPTAVRSLSAAGWRRTSTRPSSSAVTWHSSVASRSSAAQSQSGCRTWSSTTCSSISDGTCAPTARPGSPPRHGRTASTSWLRRSFATSRSKRSTPSRSCRPAGSSRSRWSSVTRANGRCRPASRRRSSMPISGWCSCGTSSAAHRPTRKSRSAAGPPVPHTPRRETSRTSTGCCCTSGSLWLRPRPTSASVSTAAVCRWLSTHRRVPTVPREPSRLSETDFPVPCDASAGSSGPYCGRPSRSRQRAPARYRTSPFADLRSRGWTLARSRRPWTAKGTICACMDIHGPRHRGSRQRRHLYHFVRQRHPEVNASFVLRRDAGDWDRLAAEGVRLDPLGSPEHVQLLFNADHLVSSQVDSYVVRPLDPARLSSTPGASRFLITASPRTTCRAGSTRCRSTGSSPSLAADTAEHRQRGSHTPYVFTEKGGRPHRLSRHDRLLELKGGVERRPSSSRPPGGAGCWRRRPPGNARGLVRPLAETDFGRSWFDLIGSAELKGIAQEDFAVSRSHSCRIQTCRRTSGGRMSRHNGSPSTPTTRPMSRTCSFARPSPSPTTRRRRSRRPISNARSSTTSSTAPSSMPAPTSTAREAGITSRMASDLWCSTATRPSRRSAMQSSESRPGRALPHQDASQPFLSAMAAAVSGRSRASSR